MRHVHGPRSSSAPACLGSGKVSLRGPPATRFRGPGSTAATDSRDGGAPCAARTDGCQTRPSGEPCCAVVFRAAARRLALEENMHDHEEADERRDAQHEARAHDDAVVPLPGADVVCDALERVGVLERACGLQRASVQHDVDAERALRLGAAGEREAAAVGRAGNGGAAGGGGSAGGAREHDAPGHRHAPEALEHARGGVRLRGDEGEVQLRARRGPALLRVLVETPL